MDKNLTRYIWKHTKKQQVWILIVVLASMYTYFLSFDVPKYIVNGPIQGKGFEAPGATQTYLNLTLSIPGFDPITIFPGFQFDRFSSLIYLCGVFLLLVIVNGSFKLYINTYKGRLGERMLRRVRYELIDKVLRFPPAQFKRLKPAEIATMVKDEVEPLGGFIGDAFVQPALLGGQAATALFFILVQNLWLGLIAAGIVGVQLIVIPKMRRRLLRLGRERQLTARELAGRISEISEGISAIHSHDTSNFERADVTARLARIFKIRYDLYQWKFMVKFLNNFLAQVTPFLFYLIGGYQVIKGTLDVGQLVAVIAAYKDLPSPLKDLIDWDQARQDVKIKYNQVYEQFDSGEVLDASKQALEVKPVPAIAEPLTVSNLTVVDDSGAKLLDRASLVVKPGEAVAILGAAGSGGEIMTEAIARIVTPESGKITIGKSDIFELPEYYTGRRMSYAASDAYLFQGELRDNLLYGLKHAPFREAARGAEDPKQREWELDEALRSGNPTYDIHADWIDYEAAGAKGPEDLPQVLLPLLDAVLMSNDLMELGLRSRTTPERHPAIASTIVDVRRAFRAELDKEKLSDVVVPFSPDSYNPEATVSENILFGTATGSALQPAELARNPYFRSLLDEMELTEGFFGAGIEIARNLIELFRELPPDHPFFQNLAFMTADEIPRYEAILKRLQGATASTASEEDRAAMIALAFPYIEPRHRFDILDKERMERIVQLRHRFLEGLPEELRSSLEPYDPEKYNVAATLIDNVLLGRIAHQFSNEADHIRQIVHMVLAEQGLRHDVIDIGLSYNVGVGGRRLTAAQRQKINLARALLKRADYVLLNRALSALDHQTQKKVLTNLLEWSQRIGYRPGVVAVLSTPTLATYFDRTVVFERGTISASGSYEKLFPEKAPPKVDA